MTCSEFPFYYDFTWEGWENEQVTTREVAQLMSDRTVAQSVVDVLGKAIGTKVEIEVIEVPDRTIRREAMRATLREYRIRVNGEVLQEGAMAALTLSYVLTMGEAPEAFVNEYQKTLWPPW